MKVIISSLLLMIAICPEVCWGAPGKGQVIAFGNVPATSAGEELHVTKIDGQPVADATAVAAGRSFALALKANGKVVGWGLSHHNEANVPAGLADVVAISAGEDHSLALKGDGTVIAWGDDSSGATDVPSSLANVVAIAAGSHRSIALKKDGTLMVWGLHSPLPDGLTNLVAVATGGYGNQERNVALAKDGTVKAWGRETIYKDATPPPGLTNVIAIAAGWNHSLALTSNGTVIGWGFNGNGQATGVPNGKSPYTGSGVVTIGGKVLTDVIAIAAGNEFSLALTRDGKVIAWGGNRASSKAVKASSKLHNVISISAGSDFGVAVTTDVQPVTK